MTARRRPEVTLPLAGREVRLAAALLDQAIVVGLPAVLALYGVVSGADPDFTNLMAVVVGLFLVLCQVFLLSYYGQTMAKALFGMQIVAAGTDHVGGFIRNVLVRHVGNGLLCAIPGYALADVLWIFGRGRRCLHDWIADTQVIRLRTAPVGMAWVVIVATAGCVGFSGMLAVASSPDASGPWRERIQSQIKRLGIIVAEKRAQQAVQQAQVQYGLGHPVVAQKLGELGIVYVLQHRDDEAIEQYDRAGRMFLEAGSLYIQWAAKSFQDIGYLYLVHGQLDAAASNLLYALELHEPRGRRPTDTWAPVEAMSMQTSEIGPPPDFPYLHARCLGLLGRLMAARGEYVEAESYYQRSLSRLEGMLFVSEDDAELIDPLVGLAEVYLTQDNLVEAKPLLNRALRIAESLGPERWETAKVLKGWAGYYAAVGNSAQAQSSVQRARAIASTLDVSSPEVQRLIRALEEISGVAAGS